MNAVDSSAWLEYFANDPNASFFAAAIEHFLCEQAPRSSPRSEMPSPSGRMRSTLARGGLLRLHEAARLGGAAGGTDGIAGPLEVFLDCPSRRRGGLQQHGSRPADWPGDGRHLKRRKRVRAR
jgi:hypothetical protein